MRLYFRFYRCVQGKGQQISIYMTEPQPCEYTIGVRHYEKYLLFYLISNFFPCEISLKWILIMPQLWKLY